MIILKTVTIRSSFHKRIMAREAIKDKYYDHFSRYKPCDLISMRELYKIVNIHHVSILTVQSIVTEIIMESNNNRLEVEQEKTFKEAYNRVYKT